MAFLTITNTFANSTTADATQVNANFQDVVDATSDGTIDFNIGAITVAGAATFNGNVTFGNATGDTITATGRLSGDWIPGTTNSVNFGTSTLGYASIYLGANSQTVRILPSASMSATYTLTMPVNAGTDGYLLKTNGSGVTSWFNAYDPTGLSDVQATALGLKVYSHGTTYNGGNAPTITLVGGGGTLSSVTLGDFIPYQVQGNHWRCKFNVLVAVSSTSRTDIELNVANLTFLNSGAGQVISGGPTANLALNSAFAEANTGNLNVAHASGSTSNYWFSGDVRLNSKPSWAY